VNSADTDAVTLTDSGVIWGFDGTAVQFGGGNSKLIVDAGAVFYGLVEGGSRNNTLVFNTSGKVSLSQFVGFQTIDLDKGAADSVVLTNANFAPGQTSLTIHGGNDGNTLDASATTDPVTLIGGSGADTLIAGTDTTMTGGGGADSFVFTATGINTVTDFKHGVDDLVFNNADFDLGSDDGNGTSTPHQLAADLFVSNTTGDFNNTTERFAFDTTTRQLFYSPNGDHSSALLVAQFGGASPVTVHDLFFIS
jgi:hypothetical protein